MANNKLAAINRLWRLLTRLLKFFILPVAGLIAVWLGVSLLYDEPLDPGLDAFYSDIRPVVPDSVNAAIGILGLSAPYGSDVMAYGRFVADTLARTTLQRTQAQELIAAQGRLNMSNRPGDLDCLNWPEPDDPNRPCPTEARLSEVLKDNSELLQRYWHAASLPEYSPPLLGHNGSLFIDINKLIAEEIAMKSHRGNAEAAYHAWRSNYLFLSGAIRAEDSWVGKAILAVNEGISLGSIEQLLHVAPELANSHGDELLRLLAQEGLSRWNLDGVMRTEYRLLDTAALRGELKFWVRPNFVRNRFFRAARAFLDASTGTAMDLDRRFFAVKQVHGNLDQWTWDYLFSPLNTIFARITLRGQLMAGPLVKNMLTHDGTMRLLQLRILLARNDVSDANVEQFLSSQLSLRNPFTEEPMRWDRAKRVIWFKEPGDSISRRQVRLPGGQWLDDNCEEAR